MARRKAPNSIDTSRAAQEVRDRLAWLEMEYSLLAGQRNTFAFMYNKALASMAKNEMESEKMREWKREAWRLEYIMQWIASRYHSEVLRHEAHTQMKMDVPGVDALANSVYNENGV